MKRTRVKWINDWQVEIRYEAGTIERKVDGFDGIAVSYVVQ